MICVDSSRFGNRGVAMHRVMVFYSAFNVSVFLKSSRSQIGCKCDSDAEQGSRSWWFKGTAYTFVLV